MSGPPAMQAPPRSKRAPHTARARNLVSASRRLLPRRAARILSNRSHRAPNLRSVAKAVEWGKAAGARGSLPSAARWGAGGIPLYLSQGGEWQRKGTRVCVRVCMRDALGTPVSSLATISIIR